MIDTEEKEEEVEEIKYGEKEDNEDPRIVIIDRHHTEPAGNQKLRQEHGKA